MDAAWSSHMARASDTASPADVNALRRLQRSFAIHTITTLADRRHTNVDRRALAACAMASMRRYAFEWTAVARMEGGGGAGLGALCSAYVVCATVVVEGENGKCAPPNAIRHIATFLRTNCQSSSAHPFTNLTSIVDCLLNIPSALWTRVFCELTAGVLRFVRACFVTISKKGAINEDQHDEEWLTYERLYVKMLVVHTRMGKVADNSGGLALVNEMLDTMPIPRKLRTLLGDALPPLAADGMSRRAIVRWWRDNENEHDAEMLVELHNHFGGDSITIDSTTTSSAPSLHSTPSVTDRAMKSSSVSPLPDMTDVDAKHRSPSSTPTSSRSKPRASIHETPTRSVDQTLINPPIADMLDDSAIGDDGDTSMLSSDESDDDDEKRLTIDQPDHDAPPAHHVLLDDSAAFSDCSLPSHSPTMMTEDDHQMANNHDAIDSTGNAADPSDPSVITDPPPSPLPPSVASIIDTVVTEVHESRDTTTKSSNRTFVDLDDMMELLSQPALLRAPRVKASAQPGFVRTKRAYKQRKGAAVTIGVQTSPIKEVIQEPRLSFGPKLRQTVGSSKSKASLKNKAEEHNLSIAYILARHHKRAAIARSKKLLIGGATADAKSKPTKRVSTLMEQQRSDAMVDNDRGVKQDDGADENMDIL